MVTKYPLIWLCKLSKNRYTEHSVVVTLYNIDQPSLVGMALSYGADQTCKT